MKKIQRVHIKMEKRILRLLYRTGLIDRYDPKELYWADYGYFYHNRKYKNQVPKLNVYYCTVDYWGEGNDHELIRDTFETLWWDGAYNFDKETGYPEESTFEPKNNKEFIKYLKSLPVVRNDSKINVALKVKND